MRSMADSVVAQKCINFNAYQLAASALVKQHLISHFVQTVPKDVVVIAGFGLFGQTILEELQHYAQKEIDTIAIIGIDAKQPIIILCTDSVEDNFRTSLWLKNKYPDSMIIARSYLPSKFAENVGEQYNILNVSINQLVKDNFPIEWMTP
jgi:hypothetical protein